MAFDWWNATVASRVEEILRLKELISQRPRHWL
jgi:hypothetical protein